MTKAAFARTDMVALGLLFFKHAQRQPSRTDFRGARRGEWEGVLGMKLPSGAQIEAAFGSWGKFLDACGFDGSEGQTYQKIERAAEKHAAEALGVTLEEAEQSITDGWLPDGRTVEIKGSVLREHKVLGQHFFSFRIHARELSSSCDLLVLVGLSRDLKAIVRLEIPKAALPELVDGKSNVTLYAQAVWGSGTSKFRRFVRMAERSSLPAAISEWSAGKSGEGAS